MHLDTLEALGAFGMRLQRVGVLVGGRQVDVIGEGREQCPGVEPQRAHHVELDADDDEKRRQIHPRQQPEHQGEDPIGGARVLHHMADVGRPADLQALPEQRRQQRTRGDVAETHVAGARHPERQQEQARVDEHRSDRGERLQAATDLGTKGLRAAGKSGKPRRRDDSKADRPDQQDAAAARFQRIGTLVARHPPRDVHRVLSGLGDPERAVDGDDDAECDPGGVAGEALRVAELRADDREAAERGMQDLLLQVFVAAQDHAEKRGQQEQQRKQRDERVVRQDSGEVGAVIVDELVDDSEREPCGRMALLERIQPSGQ